MNSKIVEQLRKEYPVGAKVELVRMCDFQAPPIGTTGIVQFVDDMGTIHVNWSTGSSLGVAYGEDKCRVID
jgi:hypothetical protein